MAACFVSAHSIMDTPHFSGDAVPGARNRNDLVPVELQSTQARRENWFKPESNSCQMFSEQRVARRFLVWVPVSAISWEYQELMKIRQAQMDTLNKLRLGNKLFMQPYVNLSQINYMSERGYGQLISLSQYRRRLNIYSSSYR